MEDCVFCKIVNGKVPAYKLYEDEDVLAFLDINPVNKGHVLVIPKEHYKNLLDLPEELFKKISVVIKKILSSLESGAIGEGYNLLQNNYEAAGQDVFHIHFHIIPRVEGDESLKFKWIEKPSSEEMKKIAEKIRKALE